MSRPDLNLLVTLDVLLAEGSVAKAARRLRLSPSAISRALARLREVTGDPLLVRAGRGLVPTPQAIELRQRVGQIVQEAEALLRPAETLDLKTLARTFTLRNREGFVDTYGPALLARVAREAPGVKLRFVPKPNKESTPLRDGIVDLETGVIGEETGPEVRAQALFRDRFIGIVRDGHPLLDEPITPERYAAGGHILVSRGRRERGPVDEALALKGLTRTIAVTVPSFTEAVTLARNSDLIAQVSDRSTLSFRDGVTAFALPVDLPDFTVSLLWHPRMDADPAHRWLRTCLREICQRP
ncbi:LysR family transcriptional regulator [Shinella curvata]|uniref:LysR family transcriptional regulator n=1 Tax=Shinella curvata TaxID=1817964 RepID=A0ABT8XLH0_9HYPH|nr:LysR family transcriptional regulator [Shinella curvata]MCJ8056390.1 LysR family transcriptional regulator [Shinella curvata]MDO6124101.1 LysR family transcriptional regulator [Shinella curvata]